MNVNIEISVKHCSVCLGFQQMQPKEKIIPCKIPAKLWQVIGVDKVSISNRQLSLSCRFSSKFSVVKKEESLSEDSLINCFKIIFAEYGFPKKIMSDADANFVSKKFRDVFGDLSIQQILLLS